MLEKKAQEIAFTDLHVHVWQSQNLSRWVAVASLRNESGACYAKQHLQHLKIQDSKKPAIIAIQNADAPVLSNDKDLLVWEPVDGADSYNVHFGDGSYLETVSNTNYLIKWNTIVASQDFFCGEYK